MDNSRKICVAIVAATALAVTAPGAHAALVSNTGIPINEKAGFNEVYRLEVPDTSGGWNHVAIPYSIDNSLTTPTGYTRVAYYLELGVTGHPEFTQYAYASFDVRPEFANANELGIPSNGPNGSGQVFKLAVTNMHVYTNANATTGIFATGGNLEFWPSNYGQGANGVFDYDDDGFNNGNGHGSFQIHNGGLAQTLIAYNAWGDIRDSELGVGTQIGGSGNPDWTFATGNNDNFDIQTLQIFVQTVPEPASLGLLSLGGLALVRRRRA
jgi:hypothetical protein